MRRFLSIIITMSCINANSQITVSMEGGINLVYQHVNFATETSDYNKNKLASFNVGLLSNIDLSNKFSVQPGIKFSQKGSSESFSDSTNYYPVKQKTQLNYLELSTLLTHKTPVGKTNFLIGCGPFIAYGTSGKFTQSNM